MIRYFMTFYLVLLSNGEEIVNQKQPQPCRSDALAQANRRFAFDLFHQIAGEHPDENIFIAPLVVNMGLSMLLEGSRGRTREQLAATLQLNSSMLDYRSDNLGCIYEKYNKDTQPRLTTAAKIFGERSMNFRDEFLVRTSLYADNKLKTVDFAQAPEQSRSLINEWVSGKTAGSINDLFPQGSISVDTKLALASVLYFKGDWIKSFTSTLPSQFFLNSTHSVPVEMMHREMDVRYYFDFSTELFFVELPYQYTTSGIEVSMILVLDLYRAPGYAEAERRLTKAATENAVKELLSRPARTADVFLPRFNITASYDLRNSLRAMGIRSLFDPSSADLSGMTNTTQQNLYVSQALQKTYLSVDKQGSEAAGAFGLGIIALSLPPQFRFEKPFHLIIYEKNSKNILFMGRIVNPNL